MSNTHLINWLEALFFGSKHILNDPPKELKRILLQMETNNISWNYIISKGGFTNFAYQVHGDLSYLIDHLEEEWPPTEINSLKTRVVSKFWNQLQLLLAQHDTADTKLPLIPEEDDDTILKNLLKSQKASKSYQSAKFWGEVARRFINIRRPLNEIHPLPNVSSEYLKRAMKLYDITCQIKGHYWDPYSMHLVPHSEYVNSVHWKSDQLLESFINANPNHDLTQSIQKLFYRAFNHFLNGQRPVLKSWPEMDSFLHNIQIIHENIKEVPHEDEPPKLIDVFQRLLALCYKDNLWEKSVHLNKLSNEITGTDLFLLTEQLQSAERQNKFIWTHFANDSKSLR